MLPALLLALGAAPAPDYGAVKAHLESLRATTRTAWQSARGAAAKRKVLEGARAELIKRFEDELFPAWAGTGWDFDGMSERPREGKIACGYYISTLMRDAGFRVDRIHLAQQAAANIARTLAPADRVRWYRDVSPEALLTQLRADTGEGLYVVGLPNHVVFLHLTPGGGRVCHANYLDQAAVTCEDALTSPAFQVNLYVTAPLFDDALLERWLAGAPIPTVRR